jgi:glycosyltransferase involved in cell wall biosynthesis
LTNNQQPADAFSIVSLSIKKPVVSVLVTVYMRTQFISSALESVLNQTFRDYEIIILDDSGNSICKDICKHFLGMGHVRYQANSQTLGVACSLRNGINDSKGEFVAILNDDDLWEPDFLASLLPPLQADSRRVLAFSDHSLINANGELELEATEANTARYGRAFLPEGEIANPAEFVLVKNGVPLAMASVFRKKALDTSSLTQSLAGAYDFWISCALASTRGTFYYVPRRLTSWRLHSRMETSRRSVNKFDCEVYIITQIIEQKWFPEMQDYLSLKLSQSLFRVGRGRMDFNEPASALYFFSKSFFLRPSLKDIIALLICLFQIIVLRYLRYNRDKKTSIINTHNSD